MSAVDDGWMAYDNPYRPRPQRDLILMWRRNGDDNHFIACANEFRPEFNIANLEWKLTGIAKHQLEQKGYRQS